MFDVLANTNRIELKGDFIQGGIVIGQVPTGTKVFFEKEKLRVSPEGIFVIGFGRDAAPHTQINVVYPDGGVGQQNIEVAKREYAVQRIDGLPSKQVTPDAKALARIQKENAMIGKARKIDDPRLDFTEDFIWPAQGRISGVFGSQRILNGKPKRPHYGVDIAAPTGTLVQAPASGIVTLAHSDMYYSGGTVILDHGHGISSVFIHLHEVSVKLGDRLEQGDKIGTVGSTGRATGPHLHWGMNWFKKRLDPRLLLPE